MEHQSSAPLRHRSAMWPILLTALLLVLQAGFINVLQIRTHTPLYPVTGFAFGGDAMAFLGWGSFFDSSAFKEACPFNDRLTHPPFFKQLLSLLPIVSLPSELSRLFWGNILCVLSSSILVAFIFLRSQRLAAAAAVFSSALLSYPVLMLFDRGNIDGWVGLFMLGGIFGVSRNKYFMAGLLITFAIASKVYPVVLLAPLFLQFQVRTLLWSAVTFALIYLSAPDAWHCFVMDTLASRWRQGSGNENASLLASLSWLYNAPLESDITLPKFFTISIVVIGLNLILDLVSNRKMLEARDRAAWLLLYLPVMLAYPKTVYHYCLWSLLLLPVAYAYLLSSTHSRILGLLVFVCCVAVAISQFPAISFDAIQYKVWGVHYYKSQGLPGFGAFVLLFCHILIKCIWLQQMPSKVKATPGGGGTSPTQIYRAPLGVANP